MAEEKKTRKIAVVRIRGRVDVRRTIKHTMEMLSIPKVNWVTVIDDTPTYIGMIKKAKDFITWGDIDEKTFTQLAVKWGRKAGDKRMEKAEAEKFAKDFMAGKTTFKKAGVKPVFKLHAPTKGHASAGIKKHVAVGGSLGDRGKDINALLAKMAGLKDGSKK